MAERGHGSKTRKWEESIAALLQYSTVKEAAQAVGIHENTLLKFMQMDEFNEKYKAARQTVLSAATGRLQGIVGDAVNTLHSVMVEDESPASSRVSAARCVLEMSVKFIETEQILDRLEKIEAIVNERGVIRSA